MPSIGETRLDSTRPRAAPAPVVVSGRYRIVGPLSKGGMAELSLAMQQGVQGFSRVVALKRVLPTHAGDARFVEMFLDEGRLAARLDHPNIVRIYELGQDGDTYFLAMEYLPGEDLRQLHNATTQAGVRVSPDLAAHLVARAADGLHFAHELTDEHGAPLHLVHRDVSPSNLIVTYDGQVKVVDFGIAKATSNAFETGAGVMKGKLGYLAPEQFTGAPVDRRSDVFGLGIVLWELLTNSPLFLRDSAAATMAAASIGEVPPLSAFRDDVSPELEAIALRALAHEPELRFQTAGELRDELEHLLRTEATPPTARDVAEWIQGLGGTRRAELKMAIARGTNVVASYDELRALPWETPGLTSLPSLGPRRRGRAPWQLGLFAALGAASLGLAGWFTSGRAPVPGVAVQEASARLESEPPGAFVFIRGEPSGRVTPVTLTGLDPDQPLPFRLEKPGYASVSDALALEPGVVVRRQVTLVATQGVVTFVDLPRGAAVRVGEQVVLEGQQVLVPVGAASVEVLRAGRVVSTQRFTVTAGPQQVRLTLEGP